MEMQRKDLGREVMSMKKANISVHNVVFVDFRSRPCPTSTPVWPRPPMLIERSSFPLFRSSWRKIPESARLAELAQMAIGLGLPTRNV
jgi:hypothetical protein